MPQKAPYGVCIGWYSSGYYYKGPAVLGSIFLSSCMPSFHAHASNPWLPAQAELDLRAEEELLPTEIFLQLLILQLAFELLCLGYLAHGLVEVVLAD